MLRNDRNPRIHTWWCFIHTNRFTVQINPDLSAFTVGERLEGRLLSIPCVAWYHPVLGQSPDRRTYTPMTVSNCKTVTLALLCARHI